MSGAVTLKTLRADPDAVARARFGFYVGLLLRGQLRQALRAAAWDLDLEVEITEERSLLSSWIGVRVRGRAKAVADFWEWADSLPDQANH